jgi:O-antigen/teichoic acid export membrane protein
MAEPGQRGSGPPAEDETTREIVGMARGGSIGLAGAVCTQLSLVLITLLLARWLGREDVGRYAQAYAFLVILSLLSLSGFGVAMTRFVAVHLAMGNQGAVRGTIRLGVTFASGASMVLGLALWAMAPWLAGSVLHDAQLTMPLRVVACCLPLVSYTYAALAATMGYRTMRYSALIGHTVEPLARMVLTAVSLLLGHGLAGPMIALVISNAVAAVLAAWALRRKLGRPVARPSYNLRQLLSFSMVSWMGSLATTGLIWADTIMLGIFVGSDQVGLYNVATRLVTMATFVMPAITSAFAPRIADLYHRGRTESLRRTYAVATSWVLRLSLPGFVACAALPSDLLRVFGRTFVAGAAVTLILVAGKFVHVITGPCGRMLDMSGRPIWSTLDNVTALTVNILLNLWLIPRHGIIGAAIAWAFSIFVVDGARMLQVWRIMGMLPFDRGAAKSLVAAAGAWLVAWLIGGWFQPPLRLPLGLAALAATYLGLLLAQGITTEDRLALGVLTRRLRGATLSRAASARPRASWPR